MRWTLRILGEPCAKGTGSSTDECWNRAMAELKKRRDYGSIFALGDLACVDIQISREGDQQ